MQLLKKFIKLMKSEPKRTNKSFPWTIDESKCLSIAEVRKMRIFCNKSRGQGLKIGKFTPVRNWFMIELALNTGLRVEEMTSLKHSNLLIDTTRSSIVVIGKGNKKRSIWISSAFKKTCQAYLDYKTQFGYDTGPDSYLLNNLLGNKITKRALQKFFKTMLIKSGLPRHYYIHCLRHTYTTFLLKASNYNYRFVQQQLGHASIRTTQIYAGVIESDGRKAVEKLFS